MKKRTFDLGRILAFDYGEEMPTDSGIKFFVKTNGLPSVLYGAPIEVNESKTIGEEYLDKMLYVDSEKDIVLTVPNNEEVPFPLGSEIEIYRAGVGEVEIAAASGVKIQCSVDGRSIGDRYLSAFLKKVKENTWALQGAIV